jgi:hypothetical protein
MAPRNLLLAGCGLLALAGCSGQQLPQSSMQPAYYDWQQQQPWTYSAPPRSYTPPQSRPYYGEPAPAPRYVEPQPPSPSPARSRPATPRPSPPRSDPAALEPADPDCGWWDPCWLWSGT